ncbi:cupredoxin domain-containing protein [Hydrogenophilus thermoluteolus]|jgi:plastocyanin domain-containing protein|uniref:EfeO-type cupredoxin-like domain-containing protein n=1 Tax=Hydrogenophilus thermoluteolus TaxID=297 RepID=A0A2Z6DYS1_HYDTE|nr:cupredoxin domain-containing protein [Hydrogenophilus thermoluteolus]HCO77984.1 plastocyanin [Rhodocyclaceae bacterium]MBW7656033.1 cupredoxin domain-containing protein [Hydrogenophilus thermoluteolus]BBD77696.1 hypothetical protein HPTL_1434 [Hydrogenophilus thermoluteolus]GLW59951.1 ATPase [Hydrogenophilus thermoluteolus]HNQ48987.1 cupredoxin domain-containing protein [Hydrogenophilus thermoluteolus]
MMLLNLLLIGAAAFIIYWFWLWKPASQDLPVQTHWKIIAENGAYTPGVIRVPAGQPVTLEITRKDPSPCAEQIVFEGANVTETLPLNKTVTVTVTWPAPGEYPFHCQMNMLKGRVEVV